jgi:hypothetical protein
MYRMNRKGSRRKPTMRRVCSPICVALSVIIVEAAMASQRSSGSPERVGKYISESGFRRHWSRSPTAENRLRGRVVISPAAIREPATLGLMAVGIGAIARTPETEGYERPVNTQPRRGRVSNIEQSRRFLETIMCYWRLGLMFEPSRPHFF